VLEGDEEVRNMPYDEQEDVLKKYLDKFGLSTKLKSSIAWRIARKD
jgi:hypothetical protein